MDRLHDKLVWPLYRCEGSTRRPWLKDSRNETVHAVCLGPLHVTIDIILLMVLIAIFMILISNSHCNQNNKNAKTQIAITIATTIMIITLRRMIVVILSQEHAGQAQLLERLNSIAVDSQARLFCQRLQPSRSR